MALPVWLSYCLLIVEMVRQKRDSFALEEKRRRIETRASPPPEPLEERESSRVPYGEVESNLGDVCGSGDLGDNWGTAVAVKEEAADTESVASGLGEVEEGLWTEDRENRLIELYRKCPFLYDKTLPSYKLKHKKHVAYTKFGSTLGVPGMSYYVCGILCHDAPPLFR